MTCERLFILGAGFSKQAGMPLATELTPLVLDKSELRDLKDFQGWVKDIRIRIARVEDSAQGASLNIEQLFDFASFDVELFRMRHQACRVGRSYGDTPWQKAEEISNWLRYLSEYLAHVIWACQREAEVAMIKPFAENLRSNDIIITFNYDTLLETTLRSLNMPWNHGLDDVNQDGTTILKMHGSIDWVVLERRPENKLQKFTKLFSKTDENVRESSSYLPEEDEYRYELWRVNDATTLTSFFKIDSSGLSNFPYKLGLSGLGRYKPLHQLPGTGPTWDAAFRALREAQEIYVVGFAMSPYDSMSRFHFASVCNLRGKPPAKVVIIDPNAFTLAQAFRGVFGNKLTLLASVAEKISWSRTLSADR